MEQMEQRVIGKGRIVGIDAMKFLMAVVVVSIHASPFRSWEMVNTLYNQIISDTAVPFFFVVSGYLIGAGALRKADAGGVCHSLRHMLKIYIIWGLWYQLLEIAKLLIRGDFSGRELLPYVRYFLCGSPNTLMWYVGVIIFCLMIAVLIKRAGTMNEKIIEKSLLTTLLIGIGFYIVSVIWQYPDVCGEKLENLKAFYDEYFPSQRIVLFRSFWFFGGLFIGYKGMLIKVKKYQYTFYGIGLIALVCGLIFYWKLDGAVSLIAADLSLIVYRAVFVVILLLAAVTMKVPKCISEFQLGLMSTAMYFIHYTVIYTLRLPKEMYGFTINCVIEFILCIIITMIISKVMISIRKIWRLLF